MINSEEKITKLIDDFEGKVCLYAIDEQNNIIKFNENEIVETASCIKLFILIEYYNQILKNEKSRDDLINYSVQNDYVENGSGIICFSPLAQGLLTDKYFNGIPENSRAAGSSVFLQTSHITPERIEASKQLNEIAQQRNQSLAQMALAWILSDD